MARREIMYTSNPAYEYLFSWTIDDFHNTSLVVQGPAFTPIPLCSDKFCFEVQFECDSRNFYFKLLDLTTSNTHYRTVCGNATLQNKETILWDATFNDRLEIEKCTILMTHNPDSFGALFLPNDTPERQLLSSFGLADGKLTLYGSLTFRGFLATSSISSISVLKPPEDCGELAKDLKSLYESGFGSDVTFTVGDKMYPAHKLVLSARSVVLAKMFEHDMLERSTNNVTIEDIDPDTFNDFLLFLYTGALEEGNSPAFALDLYAVAKKYQVKSLWKACVALLGNSLTIDSLFDSLIVADLHNDEEFKFMVKAFFRENFFNVVGTTMWAEIVTTRPALANEVLDFMKPVSE